VTFYADLHVHSKYSRATSRDCDLEQMAFWARKKGVAVLGTGDFTHPAWLDELRRKLVPAEPGLYRLRADLQKQVDEWLGGPATGPVRFMLQVEISTIYKKDGRTRKVHHLIYAPDLEKAQCVQDSLARIGNVTSDGRPILGLDSRHLLEIALESGEGCYLIPAHIWTPWFAVLGSKSGFDTIEQCYDDLSGEIFALETGLSSDPAMNWRLSSLDRYALVSNSDAHSPPRIGREACVFDTEIDYFAMRRALETGQGYGGTVEFFPEEGKYHFDGHRKCGVSFSPGETRKHAGLCPECGKPLTLGVMHRVDELADRPDVPESLPPRAAPFRSFVALDELLSEILGVGRDTKTVKRRYEDLVSRLGPELFILEHAALEDIRRAGSSIIAEAIARMRQGRVIRAAGFDGQYGTVRMFTNDELRCGSSVGLLFDLPEEDPKPGPPAEHTAPASDFVGPDVPAEKPIEKSAASIPPISDRILDQLDPEQQAAALITHGPLLIVAGPGTGKTRTLTHRLAHLVSRHGVPPEQCLAITFTRRAAGEMTDRLAQLLPDACDRLPVMTFHALGLSMLEEHGSRLGLPQPLRVACRTECLRLLQEALAVGERKANRLLAQISHHKRRRVYEVHQIDTHAGASLSDDRKSGAPRTPSDSGDCPDFREAKMGLSPSGSDCRGAKTGLSPSQPPKPDPETAHTLDVYQQQLRARGLVDFDDLLVLPVRLLETSPDLVDHYRSRYRWVSVDEYQDIDHFQYRLIKLLVPADGNLCAIGDPDQAIYGFRGADVSYFQRFQEDFPAAKTVSLVRNYRSTRTIVDASLQVIAPESLIDERSLWAQVEGPDRIEIHQCATDRAEAEFVVHTIERMIGGSVDSGRVQTHEGESLSFGDFAVLYRTDAQADALIEAFARSGMPFQKRSHDSLADQPAVETLVRLVDELPEGQSVPERLDQAAAELLADDPQPRRSCSQTIRSWRRRWRRSARWPSVTRATPGTSSPNWRWAWMSTCGKSGPTALPSSRSTRPRAWSSPWCSSPAAKTAWCRSTGARPPKPTWPKSAASSSWA